MSKQSGLHANAAVPATAILPLWEMQDQKALLVALSDETGMPDGHPDRITFARPPTAKTARQSSDSAG